MKILFFNVSRERAIEMKDILRGNRGNCIVSLNYNYLIIVLFYFLIIIFEIFFPIIFFRSPHFACPHFETPHIETPHFNL